MIKRASPRTVESHPERGAVLVLVAISMVALIGIVALTVDLGYLLVTRNEVQNVADGASLAGARKLGALYQERSYTEQQDYYCGVDCQTQIRAVAQDVAAKNRAGGRAIEELEGVFVGRWSRTSPSEEYTFTENPYRPNAVMVIARRDTVENTPVSTFFARVLRINEVPVNAQAIAAMTGQGTVQPGELVIPVALDQWFFEALPEVDRCNDYIQFYPTGEACAGWTTWDSPNASAARLNEILKGDYESPLMVVGDDIRMTSGLQASNLVHFLIMFQDNGCATTAHEDPEQRRYLLRNGGTSLEKTDCVSWEEVLGDKYEDRRVVWEEDGAPTYYPGRTPPYKDDTSAPRYYHLWDTTVPIYGAPPHDPGNCPPPTQRRDVVGFARVLISDVRLSSDDTNKHEIIGTVICEQVSPYDNRGGGGEYGTFGPIPGLVR